MPTMLDVAKRAGVSLSTVSYAINGTRPISEETRQRIFKAMDEIGYRPHALARGLASKRSRIIALLFPTPERGLGTTELEFVTSAADAATGNGYHLVLWSSEMHDPNELRSRLQQGLVDGVIVMEVYLRDPRIDWLRQAQIPFSVIGRSADSSDTGYVDIDFLQTTRDAVQHLAELGHTRIAFINQSQAEFEAGYGPAVRAQDGFEQAIQEAGLAGYSMFCHPAPRAGYEIFTTLLKENPDVTALIVMNDRAVPGIMQAVAARGWRVPDDISLISIVSSARMAEMTVPALTALEPPSVELGRLGVELLIQQLETHDRATPQELLPCRLVVRESTGVCRRNNGPAG